MRTLNSACPPPERQQRCLNLAQRHGTNTFEYPVRDSYRGNTPAHLPATHPRKWWDLWQSGPPATMSPWAGQRLQRRSCYRSNVPLVAEEGLLLDPKAGFCQFPLRLFDGPMGFQQLVQAPPDVAEVSAERCSARKKPPSSWMPVRPRWIRPCRGLIGHGVEDTRGAWVWNIRQAP